MTPIFVCPDTQLSGSMSVKQEIVWPVLSKVPLKEGFKCYIDFNIMLLKHKNFIMFFFNSENFIHQKFSKLSLLYSQSCTKKGTDSNCNF